MRSTFTDFIKLSQEKQEELSRLSTKALNAAKAFQINLKILQEKEQNILQNSLNELKKLENFDAEKIKKIYDETIGASTKAVSQSINNYYKGQLETTDIFLFDGILAEKILNLLESFLRFEKELDKLYPGTSAKIINGLEILLVGVLATHMPMLSVMLESSGILGTIKDFIQVDNLLPKVTQLNKEIKEMREKKFGIIYDKAQIVSEIAEKSEAAPITVAQLNLKEEALKEVNKVIENSKDKNVFHKFIDFIDLMPKNKKELDEKFLKIKSEISNIKENGLQANESIKKIIVDNLSKAQEELSNVLKPQTTIFEKITSVYKSINHLSEISSKIQKTVSVLPGGKEFVQAVEEVVRNKILPKNISLVIDGSAKLMEAMGGTNVMRQVIQSLITQSQGRQR